MAEHPLFPSLPRSNSEDWRTTDEQEVAKRRARAEAESFQIRNLDERFIICSNFQVTTVHGSNYMVEVRAPFRGRVSCNCPDFRINGLGTCKHSEAVFLHLQQTQPEGWHDALKLDDNAGDSPRAEIIPDRIAQTLRVDSGRDSLPEDLQPLFDDLDLLHGVSPEEALEIIRDHPDPRLRISQEVDAWLEDVNRKQERIRLRRDYEQSELNSQTPYEQHFSIRLLPYQREAMLHFIFNRRAVLADELGLDSMTPALAACERALTENFNTVLIITPESRRAAWQDAAGKISSHLAFHFLSYEELINRPHTPEADVVILDEAQRMGNWTTQTAAAVRQIQSEYAFVLARTDFEERLDELYAVLEFIDPALLGPLFRFNRNFYILNDQGRAVGTKNIPALRRQIQPVFLHRTKSEVEVQLPEASQLEYRIALGSEASQDYHSARSVALDSFQREWKEDADPASRLMQARSILHEMRALCLAPKLPELEQILRQIFSAPETKAIVFSESDNFLLEVRSLCEQLGVEAAWHTDQVPLSKRRIPITQFRTDPDCRVLLATDEGSSGLRQIGASYLIHADIPLDIAALSRRELAVRGRNGFPVTSIWMVTTGTLELRARQRLQKETSPAGEISGRDLEDLLEIYEETAPVKHRLDKLDYQLIANALAQKFGESFVSLQPVETGHGKMVLIVLMQNSEEISGAVLEQEIANVIEGNCERPFTLPEIYFMTSDQKQSFNQAMELALIQQHPESVWGESIQASSLANS